MPAAMWFSNRKVSAPSAVVDGNALGASSSSVLQKSLNEIPGAGAKGIWPGLMPRRDANMESTAASDTCKRAVNRKKKGGQNALVGEGCKTRRVNSISSDLVVQYACISQQAQQGA